MTDNSRPRRMDYEFAELFLATTKAARHGIATWRAAHPDVADWRVEEANRILHRAVVLARYLSDNIDPEGDEARAELARKRPELFTEEEES